MDRTAKHKVIGFTLRYTNYLTGKNYRAGQWRIMPGQEFARRDCDLWRTSTSLIHETH